MATECTANEAWEAVMGLYQTMVRGFQRDDVWVEASMTEYDVLYTLAKSRVPLRQSQVLEGTLLSQPAISRMIDRLVDRGLVRRVPDPQDRRSHLLELTDEGRAVQKAIGRRHGAVVADRMARALTPDQLTQLRDLAATATKALHD